MKRIICLTALEGDTYRTFVEAFGGAEVIRAHDLGTLRTLSGPNAILFSFGSGLIIPSDVLKMFDAAFNIHAAPPEFPGRDPHHHAAYAGCENYGATLHHMEDVVDAGPIIDVERFIASKSARPEELLAKANEAGMRLVRSHGIAIAKDIPLPSSPEIWSGVKTRRSDLTSMSHIPRFIGPEELLHRYQAFDGGAHDNLTTKLFDLTFRIDKHASNGSSNIHDWTGFTEQGYCAILKALTKYGYTFSSYHARPEKGRHVIWRHDVDVSLQRALWCAQAEQDAGAVGTYFINPRCEFYNLAEPESLRCLRAIADLGHEIGLHFDAGAMGVASWNRAQLDEALHKERALVEAITGCAIRTVSWHNPDLSNLLDFDDEQIGGLINAYSQSLRSQYTYCSDSNGYWRYTPMPDVIEQGHEKLHLLTHPAWWTPLPMPPRARIERAVVGRASAISANYDKLLEIGNRINVKT